MLQHIRSNSVYLSMQNKQYNYLINGDRVEITKVYRTKSQFEYYLNIFMGDSDYESILNYRTMFLTKKNALEHAKYVITEAPQPRIEKM